jgi:hypothetical protein
MRARFNLSIASLAYCLPIVLVACGGGSSSPPPPSISVSVSQTSATVQAGATADFAANVSNDPSNSGVEWSVSCPTAPCGTVSPASTSSGAPARSWQSHGRRTQGPRHPYDCRSAALGLTGARKPLRSLRRPSLRIGSRYRREPGRTRSADAIHLRGGHVRTQRSAR